MSSQLNDLRLQVERLDYDNKESVITIDILNERNQDTANELEELKRQILEMRSTQKDPSAEDKEKRKQEKMALMMAKFDTVSSTLSCGQTRSHKACVCSKEHSPKRTNSFAQFLPSSMVLTLLVEGI